MGEELELGGIATLPGPLRSESFPSIGSTVASPAFLSLHQWRAHNRYTVTMTSLPPCPKCLSALTYEDGAMLVCPECAHEWSKDGVGVEAERALEVRDAHGNTLQDGDSVTVIKDLKVKGSSSVVKVGTKVKGIRLVEGDHNIDCRIEGIGEMKLKSEFVKKA
jgi:protein PhnA